VGLNSLKSLNLTNVYPNNNKNNKKNNNNKNNKVKSKPLELFELAGKKLVESRRWKKLGYPIFICPRGLDNYGTCSFPVTQIFLGGLSAFCTNRRMKSKVEKWANTFH
jgi:hypothetical protein